MPSNLCWPEFSYQAGLWHCVLLFAARLLSLIFSRLTMLFLGSLILSGFTENYLLLMALAKFYLSLLKVKKWPQLALLLQLA